MTKPTTKGGRMPLGITGLAYEREHAQGVPNHPGESALLSWDGWNPD